MGRKKRCGNSFFVSYIVIGIPDRWLTRTLLMIGESFTTVFKRSDLTIGRALHEVALFRTSNQSVDSSLGVQIIQKVKIPKRTSICFMLHGSFPLRPKRKQTIYALMRKVRPLPSFSLCFCILVIQLRVLFCLNPIYCPYHDGCTSAAKLPLRLPFQDINHW